MTEEERIKRAELLMADHELACKKHHISSYGKEIFKWEWGTLDHEGIWAYGGNNKDLPAVLLGATLQVPCHDNVEGWYCYIGPVPNFTPPTLTQKQFEDILLRNIKETFK